MNIEKTVCRKIVFSKIREVLCKNYRNKHAISFLLSKGITMEAIMIAMERQFLAFMPTGKAGAEGWLEKHLGQTLLHKAGLAKPGRSSMIASRQIAFVFEKGECAEFMSVMPGVKSVRYGDPAKAIVWKGDPKLGALIVDGMMELLIAVSNGFKGDIIVKPTQGFFNRSWLYHYAKAQRGGAGVIVALADDKKLRNHNHYFAASLAKEAINRAKRDAAVQIPGPFEEAALLR